MMYLIRGFLWTLVAIMTLQGFLHADEYGTATSMIGGVSMSMAIMRENVGRSLFVSSHSFVPLPRVIVQSALKETALHPGIQVVPKLRRTLAAHQLTWDRFRDEEITWLLEHADLIGGVHSDPEARVLWVSWDHRLNYSQIVLNQTRAMHCPPRFMSSPCVAAPVAVAATEVRRIQTVVEKWNQVLYLNRWVSAFSWWTAIHPEVNGSWHFDSIKDDIARLHDVEVPVDPRIALLLDTIHTITEDQSSWLQRILRSLLTGEVWAGCLEHVRLREGRVRDLMMLAGIQDMYNAHEGVLNASLRVVDGDKDKKRLVQDWFGEMSGYAWWLSDELPSLVRRCVGQDAGDCTRIGPTEIVSLSAKIAEREKIVGNWVRRIYIGMWNAMPVIGILFVLEIIVLCLGRGSVMLRLDDRQIRLNDRQMRLNDRQKND